MALEALKEIQNLLSSNSQIISYQPKSAEVSPTEIFPEALPLISYVIPPVATIDPFEEVAACGRDLRKSRIIVFIPGRAFDASGTRHGKGFGWYDRFLSAAPQEWIRIGFCFSERFSHAALTRESWDEPMDFVCVLEKESGKVTCYETFARTKAGLVY